MKVKIENEIEIPKGVTVSRNMGILVVKGAKGEIKRPAEKVKVEWKREADKITIFCKKATKREKRAINTFAAHLKNMIIGVQKPFIYKLKICSGPPQSHFPMQVTCTGGAFTVKNFLGEKVPRVRKITEGVNVKVAGNDVTIESADLELAGRTASDIEQLVRISDKDKRTFQDGIYVIEKPETGAKNE